MSRYRVWLLAAILSLTVPMLVGPAYAWEFEMDGTFTWMYETRGQLGQNGFFGKYNIDNSTATAGAGASLNGWAGSLLGDMVSGTDGGQNVQYMLTNMSIKMNPALRIRGSYYIGEWANHDGYGLGNTVASQYLNQRWPGIQRSFSPGYWNTLWLTSQLPWGTLTMGKRPSIWGMGLMWNGTENRSSETIALQADYGPLRFAIGFYPLRRSGTFGGVDSYSSAVNANAGTVAARYPADYYNMDYDKNNTRNWDLSPVPNIVYRSGPMEAGFQFNWNTAHRGPERLLRPSNNTLDPDQSKYASRTRDRMETYGGGYVKYNNGRFFFNSEVDWLARIDRDSGSMLRTSEEDEPVTNGYGRASTYIDHWRWAAEAGVIAGPAKIALLYSWSSGNDRRAGNTRGISQGMSVNAQDASNSTLNPYKQATAASNTGMYRPYSYLMVYGYGLGSHINTDTGNGYVEDASCYAARLDYAVAANLNVYGSFFWADRVGNGYGWGYLRPLPLVANSAKSTPWTVTNGEIMDSQVNGAYKGAGYGKAAAPNIPDNNLGYEIDGGFDWKLLEGLTVNATFAYWVPGKWFNWACVDKANPNWTQQLQAVTSTVGTPYTWGINPNRTIDPIWGMEFKINGEF